MSTSLRRELKERHVVGFFGGKIRGVDYFDGTQSRVCGISSYNVLNEEKMKR